MQSVVRIAVAVVLLTSALVSAYHSSAKLRRDGVLNMYPFPRVGRAGPRAWQVPANDFYIEDYEPIDKRQLYAFPRVGRADASLRDLLRADQRHAAPVKRADRTGLWFGPRIGREVEDGEDDMIQNDTIEKSEPEVEVDLMEREKRQTKSL